MVQLVRAQTSSCVPGFEHGGHDFFNVVEILLGLERVVDAVVALLVEFLTSTLRIGAKVGLPGGFDQPVTHERAGARRWH